jgi:hypothetical protein
MSLEQPHREIFARRHERRVARLRSAFETRV